MFLDYNFISLSRLCMDAVCLAVTHVTSSNVHHVTFTILPLGSLPSVLTVYIVICSLTLVSLYSSHTVHQTSQCQRTK
jgi:hypothetical protein